MMAAARKSKVNYQQHEGMYKFTFNTQVVQVLNAYLDSLVSNLAKKWILRFKN